MFVADQLTMIEKQLEAFVEAKEEEQKPDDESETERILRISEEYRPSST